jgi:hypothetical protein
VLYGLKQSAERFYELMHAIMISAGFKRVAHDICLFVKWNIEQTKVTMIVAFYVDDIFPMGGDLQEVEALIDYIAASVQKIERLGDLTRFTGNYVTRDYSSHIIHLDQKIYIDKIVSEYFARNPSNTQQIEIVPLNPELDYRLEGDKSTNTANIQKEVGQLRWLADHT